jgi:pyridoxal phosphate enzyme (YggS family)
VTVLADRLKRVSDRIEAACAAAGRNRSDVRLLAASKTRTPEQVAALHALGHTLFGENKAQELRDKPGPVAAQARARGVNAPEWHFIGHLQKNKVKYVVGNAVLVHSVDSLGLAEALSGRLVRQRDAGVELPDLSVLIEVNVSGEASKSGVVPEASLALAQAVHDLAGLQVKGLMTMPPLTDDPSKARPHFERLARLAASGRNAGLPLHELSMGMSRDFEHAIACGSTLVRVGTDLFGPREVR